MLKRKANSYIEDDNHVPAKRSHQSDAIPDVILNSKTENSTNDEASNLISSNASNNDKKLEEDTAKHSDNESKAASALAKKTESEEDIDETASTGSAVSSTGNDGDDNKAEFSSDSNSDDEPGESKWLPIAGPMSWVQRQMQEGTDPRAILAELLPGTELPEGLHEVMLWKLIVNILAEPPPRKKIETYNTIEDLVELIRTRSNIVVLTGAGVSVSCGIPDFRSRDGLYARLALEYPDLPDPQSMFDINYFRRNPHPFFKFAKEIYPGKFNPSPSHRFIKLLESKEKLLRNYTQNIDTLEQVAGIENVVQCHGSFATATCMMCKHRVTSDEVKEEIMNQEIPRCTRCPSQDEMPIIKPDIVFFGESLPDVFHEQIADDKTVCDLLIVIGSSLKVRPVSLIPSALPPNVPQILINREPLPHQTFDIELLGDCDVIVQELTRRLGWEELAPSFTALKQIDINELKPVSLPEQKVDNRFQLRLPSEVIVDQSLCSTDMETSQISSCKLNLHGDYLSPLEGSQLSVIKHLKVNSNTTDQSAPPDSATDEPISETFPSAANQSSETTSDSTSQEHSFTGKLGGSSRDHDDILPSTSATTKTHVDNIKHKISTRLPDNTYLYMEPARYVFHGAELLSDSDDETDNSDDDPLSPSSAGNIQSSHVDEITDATPHTSDIDMVSSDTEGEGHSRKRLKTSNQNRAEIINHDEDAFDAFPESSNGKMKGEENTESEHSQSTASHSTLSLKRHFNTDG